MEWVTQSKIYIHYMKIIKNFKQYNEGINHLLVGPTNDDIYNMIEHKIDNKQPLTENEIEICVENNWMDLVDKCILLDDDDIFSLYSNMDVLFFCVKHNNIEMIKNVLSNENYNIESYDLEDLLSEDIVMDECTDEMREIIEYFLKLHMEKRMTKIN